MVGWHHRLNGHGSGWTPGIGDGWEAWRATDHRVAKSRTRLSNRTELSVYMSVLISQFVPPSLFLLCLHVHSLCLFCVSITINTPINRFICTIFPRFYTCALTYDSFFYFRLTSFCTTDSRSIHISANDLISFPFIPLYICTTSPLFIHLLFDV